jgi:hypothetical protein
MTNNTSTANVPETSQQNCPLLKLLTELRLQIYGHVFQHDLDLIRSAPASYDSAKARHRGVLALLRTCRTLRIECVDTIEPLAGAYKDALLAELRLSGAHMESFSTAYVEALVPARFVARANGMHPWLVALREATHCLRESLAKFEGVCSLMRRTRSTDRTVRAHVRAKSGRGLAHGRSSPLSQVTLAES